MTCSPALSWRCSRDGPPRRVTRSTPRPRKRRDGRRARGPVEQQRVKRVAAPGEADILRGVGLLRPLVHLSHRRRGRAFAIDTPGPRAEDRLAIHRHPAGERVEDRLFLAVDGAVAALRNREQQIAVLRNHIGEPLDHRLGAFVAAVSRARGVIEPVADAGIGLPRQRADPVGIAALDVLGHSGALPRRDRLDRGHDVRRAAVPVRRAVVVVGDGLHADPAEGHPVVVEIGEIGAIFGRQIGLPGKPVRGVSRIAGRGVLAPVPMGVAPGFHLLDRGDAGWRHDGGLGIELTRVEPLPPCARAIGRGQLEGVIALARARPFGIVAVGGLEPLPGVPGVIRDSETQPGLARHLRPSADNIALGPKAHRVPAVMGAVVAVEIVVMAGERDEVFRACPFVARHQRLGLPLRGGPEALDVLHSEIGRMTIGGAMEVGHRVALLVEKAPVPVALFGHRLRTPVRPDSELGVAKPVGGAVAGGQRGPVGLEGRRLCLREGALR